MRVVSVGTVAQFCQALEDWIIDNKCNPSTPEEWDRCIEDMTKSGALTAVANINDEDVSGFKAKLKENLNVEEI